MFEILLLALSKCTVSEYGVTTCDDCDLEKISIDGLTREYILNVEKPFIITGVGEHWKAVEKWRYNEFLKHYSDEIFHLHDTYNNTVGELLSMEGYKMGHVLNENGCYSDPWRPYTPLLLSALKNDYDIPDIFLPMTTFQMGMGVGKNVGVPPENHPSSWFAMISGIKRWAISPPSKEEPPHVLNRYSKCEIDEDKKNLVCDQKPGEILWLPSWWWHETCGLQTYNIGFGGITFKDSNYVKHDINHCKPDKFETHRYTTSSIPACKEIKCLELSLNAFEK